MQQAATVESETPSTKDKVEFLSRPDAYGMTAEVSRRETHMSWVFLVGERVYKLKKPVRFPYLDFSTLSQRETACRTELTLNRRLSPDVYIEVLPPGCDAARSVDRRKRSGGRLVGRDATARRALDAGPAHRRRRRRYATAQPTR